MANEKIVVADDDVDMLELLDTLLVAEGYRITLCSESENVYQVVRRIQPDLLLLDLRMADHPEAGWQVLLTLRGAPTTADIPVLMCSGDDEFLRVRERVMRTKRCFILVKPFELDDLLAGVEEALSSLPLSVDKAR